VEEPAFFSRVSRFLTPADFSGGLYREIAQRLWERMKSGAPAGAAASLISSFETEEEQEMAAAILSRHPGDMQEDADRDKTLRELVYAVREASVDRMLSGEGGSSLQEALAAKKELQTLRSARFTPDGQV
jgi:DNA primase